MKIEVTYNKKGEKRFFADAKVNDKLSEKARIQKGQRGSGYQGLCAIIYHFDPNAVEERGVGNINWTLDVQRLSRLKLLALLRPFRGSFRQDNDMNLYIK